MKRRDFLSTCAWVGGAAGVPAWLQSSWAAMPPRTYERVRLVDPRGDPLKARSLQANRNYIFSYPYESTPCFLLNLGRPLRIRATLQTERGTSYAWPGGVGANDAIVAYSAICAHKLAYPTRQISFIRYQPEDSRTSKGSVIHCCADHSVYNPFEGAKVVSGPAPQPLAAILLEYDPSADTLYALGTVGPEQFDAFFEKYDFKLALEYGEARARALVREVTQVHEMSAYCRQTVAC